MTKQSSGSNIKNLYCVEYPGDVRDEKRMIETLGGLSTISNAFSVPNRKLECKFRPQDRFCKGTVGEQRKSVGFLLKVVKNRSEGAQDNASFSTSVIGRVKQVFRFSGLTDFQYLPFETKLDGSVTPLYDEIIPSSIKDEAWFNESVPQFLPPTTFARMDTPQGYLSKKTTDTGDSITGRTRDRRSNHVIFVSHELQDIPESPNPNTLRYIKLKLVTEEQILRMKELFEERPVWTRHALCSITKFSVVQLKYLLSISAYHFTSGPFRISWVRFGYDPRKDINARQYQIIDYRIRANVQRLVQESLPEKYNIRGRTKLKNPSSTSEECTPDESEDESLYIFKPGYLPPRKQMFYQICDIHVPEIQNKLKSYPTDVVYDHKNGWLPEEFFEETRKVIDRYLMEAIKGISDKDHDNQKQPEDIDKSYSELREGDEDDEEFFSEDDTDLQLDMDISDL